jgi:hypothetical protein
MTGRSAANRLSSQLWREGGQVSATLRAAEGAPPQFVVTTAATMAVRGYF